MLTDTEKANNWSMLMARVPVDFVRVMEQYKLDTTYDELTILGFFNAPASRGIHHDYLGGLVVHLLEMLDHHRAFMSSYPTMRHTDIINGVLLHDLHKAFMCYSYKDAVIGHCPAHAVNQMLTREQRTWVMIDGSLGVEYKVSPHVRHIVECSEGGWAANPPRETSVEAKLCYLLDELSVLDDRVRTGRKNAVRDISSNFNQTQFGPIV